MNANIPKPETLTPDFDAIPEELKQREQWVLWRWQLRQGGKNSGPKWTKPPYQASGRAAKSNDDATWASFERVKAAYLRGGFDGVGFCLSADDGLTGIDLDHCLNASLEIIKPEAEAIIRHFAGAYVERSPSGDGIRIFCAGKAPRSGKAPGQSWVEIYTHPSHRYLTVTGRPFAIVESARVDLQEAVHLQESGDKQASQPDRPARQVFIINPELSGKMRKWFMNLHTLICMEQKTNLPIPLIEKKDLQVIESTLPHIVAFIQEQKAAHLKQSPVASDKGMKGGQHA